MPHSAITAILLAFPAFSALCTAHGVAYAGNAGSVVDLEMQTSHVLSSGSANSVWVQFLVNSEWTRSFHFFSNNIVEQSHTTSFNVEAAPTKLRFQFATEDARCVTYVGVVVDDAERTTLRCSSDNADREKQMYFVNGGKEAFLELSLDQPANCSGGNDSNPGDADATQSKATTSSIPASTSFTAVHAADPLPTAGASSGGTTGSGRSATSFPRTDGDGSALLASTRPRARIDHPPLTTTRPTHATLVERPAIGYDFALRGGDNGIDANDPAVREGETDVDDDNGDSGEHSGMQLYIWFVVGGVCLAIIIAISVVVVNLQHRAQFAAKSATADVSTAADVSDAPRDTHRPPGLKELGIATPRFGAYMESSSDHVDPSCDPSCDGVSDTEEQNDRSDTDNASVELELPTTSPGRLVPTTPGGTFVPSTPTRRFVSGAVDVVVHVTPISGGDGAEIDVSGVCMEVEDVKGTPVNDADVSGAAAVDRSC